MSKAIRCDRCGWSFSPEILIDSNPEYEFGISVMHFENPKITEYGTQRAMESVTNTYTYYLFGGDAPTTDRIDLCEKCYREFLKFLCGKPIDEIKKE